MTTKEKIDKIKKEYEHKKIMFLLNRVLNFIVSFFEDDENIQPIKKDLEFIINKLPKKYDSLGNKLK